MFRYDKAAVIHRLDNNAHVVRFYLPSHLVCNGSGHMNVGLYTISSTHRLPIEKHTVRILESCSRSQWMDKNARSTPQLLTS